MKKQFSFLFFITATSMIPLSATSSDIKKGAQLYDNWPVVKGITKKLETHPLYPVDSKKKGTSTWRCKECHGWDYIGKNGRYKSGSHYTGIKGIYSSKSLSLQDLAKKLKSGKHNFSKHLSTEDISNLAAFIKNGLVDISTAFKENDMINGSKDTGKKYYLMNCASCHGRAGNDLDFKPNKPYTQGIGWAANDNPQETLHKIRWGHPGTYMPSAIADDSLSNQETIDILAFITGFK